MYECGTDVMAQFGSICETSHHVTKCHPILEAIKYNKRSPLIGIQSTMKAQRFVNVALQSTTLPFFWSSHSPLISNKSDSACIPCHHRVFRRRTGTNVNRKWKIVPQNIIYTLTDPLPRHVASYITACGVPTTYSLNFVSMVSK
ncbi:hypothetical protein TNCV_3582601 [Trichonephila clavipes]|nr:hypothetical protein TNCV_3582601 [Trichonephila clavipes]